MTHFRQRVWGDLAVAYPPSHRILYCYVDGNVGVFAELQKRFLNLFAVPTRGRAPINHRVCVINKRIPGVRIRPGNEFVSYYCTRRLCTVTCATWSIVSINRKIYQRRRLAMWTYFRRRSTSAVHVFFEIVFRKRTTFKFFVSRRASPQYLRQTVSKTWIRRWTLKPFSHEIFKCRKWDMECRDNIEIIV